MVMKRTMNQLFNTNPVIGARESTLIGRILVVEHDRAAARLAEYTLGLAGYEVLIAYDGREGIEKAIHGRPDLIILDITIPVMDGYEICRCLWDKYETASIPVLVITSKTPEKGCMIRDRIGAENYLVKPVEPVEMLDKVATLMYCSHNIRYDIELVSNRRDVRSREAVLA
jgi:two-component system alkaline phosphatase synthesis response regulator PhoP